MENYFNHIKSRNPVLFGSTSNITQAAVQLTPAEELKLPHTERTLKAAK